MHGYTSAPSQWGIKVEGRNVPLIFWMFCLTFGAQWHAFECHMGKISIFSLSERQK